MNMKAREVARESGLYPADADVFGDFWELRGFPEDPSYMRDWVKRLKEGRLIAEADLQTRRAYGAAVLKYT